MDIITPDELKMISKTKFCETELLTESTLTFFNNIIVEELRLAAMAGKNKCKIVINVENIVYTSEMAETALAYIAKMYKNAGFSVKKTWVRYNPTLVFSW